MEVEAVLEYLDTRPREEAIHVVKSIDGILRDLIKKTSTQRVRGLEKDLREYLTKNYAKAAQGAVADALQEFKRKRGTPTETDVDRFMEKVENILEEFPKKKDIKKRIGVILAAAYLILRKWSADRVRLPEFEETNIDGVIRKYIVNSQLFWIGLHFRDHLSKKVKKVVFNAMIKKKLTRAEAIPLIRKQLSELLSETKTESYFDVLSAAVMEQARNYAMLESMEQAGIEEYELWNPMDDHTSEICKFMHGKVFKVSDALGLRDKVLKAKTPEKVKTLSPWLSFEEVLDRAGISTPRKKLTTKMKQRLVNAGFMIPPFHGRCRTRMIPKRQEKNITADTLATSGKKKPATFSGSFISDFDKDRRKKKKKEVMAYPIQK